MEALTISVNETARALGVGRTSVYAMIRDGRIQAIKFNRRTLITTASLRRLIDGGG